MGKERPGYIVVEGPIGVGKTSLAKRLAESFETDLMLEGADENPFLASFETETMSHFQKEFLQFIEKLILQMGLAHNFFRL